MEAIKSFINTLSYPWFSFTLSLVLFWLSVKTKKLWTRSGGWIMLALMTIFFCLGMLDENFRSVVAKPDNVPIVMMVYLTGYFWWLAGDDAFQAQGIFGQRIYINREHKVVIAMHSVWREASANTDKAWQRAMTDAVTNALSGDRPPSQRECLASPDHTLIQPTPDSAYQCVRARNHCESGFVQDKHSAKECEAKPGCRHDPGRCFCPEGLQCICGGGPPQSCRLEEED